VNNKIESQRISFTTPPINGEEGGDKIQRQFKIKDDQILGGENEIRNVDNKLEMQFK
jgi:hypothetical protein